MTERSYDDNATLPVYYTYDNLSHAKGKLTKVTTGPVSTPFSVTEYTEFDAVGRVKKSRQTTDGTAYNEMENTYNLSGAMVEEKYPSGRIVKNVLDDEGDLQTVKSQKNANNAFWNYANHFTYTAAGAVSSMQLGNGTWESTEFNSRLQPTQIALGKVQNTTDLLKLDYTYGVVESGTLNTAKNNGNIQSQTITVPTIGSSNGFTAIQTYNYDSLNRIDDATEKIGSTEIWKQDYTFDRYGNRNFDEANTTTIPKNCGTSPNLTVCAADRKVFNPSIANTNRINLDQDGDSVNDYTFDSLGNTTKDASGRTFVYDAENKQVEVKSASNETIGQYWYDGDGRRVKKRGWINGQWEETIFVYDASSKLVAEYSTNLNPAPQVAYLTNDHLGSPRINTNENGAVISRHDYRPYGEEIIERTHAQYAGDTIRKQFTGYERDGETDLDFAQARYFALTLGRFLTADNFVNDTVNSIPGSWNLYAYVRNNPTNFVDPSGEMLRIAQIKGKDGKYTDGVNETDKAKLLGWLNHTYNCSDCVTIDKDGVIRLNTEKVSKDVLKVTKDLTDAINDEKADVGIFAANGSDNVRFAQGGQNGTDSSGRSRNVIAIDFDDFDKLSGDKAAVSSFSNYAFVHEVLHFYPRTQGDTLSSDDKTGPIENRVNEIRYVNGDLLRSTYEVTSQDGVSTAWFGNVKRHGSTKEPKRNKNNGLISESKKTVTWIANQVSNR